MDFENEWNLDQFDVLKATNDGGCQFESVLLASQIEGCYLAMRHFVCELLVNKINHFQEFIEGGDRDEYM